MLLLYNRELISEPQKICISLFQSKMPKNVENWSVKVVVSGNSIRINN